MIAHQMIGKDSYLIGNSIEAYIEANYKFPWSFICMSAAGIETALWDLQGKRENKSYQVKTKQSLIYWLLSVSSP